MRLLLSLYLKNIKVFYNNGTGVVKLQITTQERIQISFWGGGGGGGGEGPTENALVLLYDTLISGFQWI